MILRRTDVSHSRPTPVGPLCVERHAFLGAVNVLRQIVGPGDAFAIALVQLDAYVADSSMIIQAAERIRRAVGDRLILRVGPQRFAVVLEAPVDDSAVLVVTTRIHEAMRVPFFLSKGEVAMSVSLGVGLAHGHEDPSAILRLSEFALERVQANGGDATAVEALRHLEALAAFNDAA